MACEYYLPIYITNCSMERGRLASTTSLYTSSIAAWNGDGLRVLPPYIHHQLQHGTGTACEYYLPIYIINCSMERGRLASTTSLYTSSIAAWNGDGLRVLPPYIHRQLEDNITQLIRTYMTLQLINITHIIHNNVAMINCKCPVHVAEGD